MIGKYDEIRKMHKDELISKFNTWQETYTPGPDFFLNEIYRRDDAEKTDLMIKITKRIEIYTIIVAICTVIMFFVSFWGKK